MDAVRVSGDTHFEATQHLFNKRHARRFSWSITVVVSYDESLNELHRVTLRFLFLSTANFPRGRVLFASKYRLPLLLVLRSFFRYSLSHRLFSLLARSLSLSVTFFLFISFLCVVGIMHMIIKIMLAQNTPIHSRSFVSIIIIILVLNLSLFLSLSLSLSPSLSPFLSFLLSYIPLSFSFIPGIPRIFGSSKIGFARDRWKKTRWRLLSQY